MAVRRVPADWKHPVKRKGTICPTTGKWSELAEPDYIPLLHRVYMGTEEEFRARQKEWDDTFALWRKGLCPLQTLKNVPEDVKVSLPRYTKYDSYPHVVGERPCRSNYMPSWPEEELTHLMLYSGKYEKPLTGNAFPTIEELAEDLVRLADPRTGKGNLYDVQDYEDALRVVINGVKADLLPEPGETEEEFKIRQQKTVERYKRKHPDGAGPYGERDQITLALSMRGDYFAREKDVWPASTRDFSPLKLPTRKK